MKKLSNTKLITCLLPKDKAIKITRRLKEEKNILTENISHGRGVGVSDSSLLGAWIEVDILTVVIEESMADEIFEFIFFESEANQSHGGFMFQSNLSSSTRFRLPDIPVEGE